VCADRLIAVKPIPVAFHIGPLEVHTYGIGLAVTFWFAYRYFLRRLRRAGYPTQWLSGVFLWVVVSSIVGARLLHVVTNWSSLYAAHPLEAFAIWHGGLSSFGGLLFGVPTGIILTRRRCPELPIVKALDMVTPVLVAAWGVGRLLGPQFEVAGGGHQTHQWFGLYYAGQVGKRLPVPIFQAIDSFIIFGLLLLIERYYRRRPSGFIVAAAVSLWGLERFFEEYLWLGRRGHPDLGFDLVQLAGLAMFVVGAIAMLVLWLRQRRQLRDAVTSGASMSEPGATEQHDTASPPSSGDAIAPVGNEIPPIHATHAEA
jgi:phosphatidylglycerol---prolipoprotein diacylglyceryl transferase